MERKHHDLCSGTHATEKCPMLEMEMKPVKIRWSDSRRYVYQMEADEETSTCIIESVGFLVKEKSNAYVLCQDNIEGEIRGVLVIPRVNVIKITKL